MRIGENAAIIRLSVAEADWLQSMGLEYLSEQLKKGEPTVKPVGEISYRTLQYLQDLSSKSVEELYQNQCIGHLLQSVSQETGVKVWGNEGSRLLHLALELGIRPERLRKLKFYSVTWNRRLDRVLKAILLKERGYILYNGDLPRRNRIGVVALRKTIRRITNDSPKDPDTLNPILSYYITLSLRLLGIPYDR